MIIYKNCPVCNSYKLSSVFTVKDYTVSNENFEILKCKACKHLFTQGVATQIEIGKYYASENYVSHSDTQEGIVNKLYHNIRKITLIAKKSLLQHQTGMGKGKLLDIGCGTGAFLDTMNKSGWRVVGLEPDETARKKANELYKLNALPPQELFNLPNETYDAITMWHVLEHVHQLHEYVAQLKNLISPKGKIFIAVPNYTSYDAQHYKTHWAAYDVPRHLYHFSPHSMQALVEQHGLKITKIKPMWFDSFYVSMLSEQYKNGKGNIAKAFFIGLVSNVKTLFNTKKCSSLIYVIGKN
jgi:2-polyprenyl-3-methyl-5-hydroxy-6-metoxy-1,4-benzoquinol methylase